ncbi:MAG TPA: ATPase P [Candidatus Tectomicrobia bacterium]|nr:ATPase P [Candidatus Tectomicrobia bacterium]
MLEIVIPGYRTLRLEHLVLDYNGTLACDGELLDGVRERLDVLTDRLQIHILTADTFGKARVQLADVRCALSILPIEDQDRRKLEYIERLGPETTVCVGNGRNDRLMLQNAGLSIVVIQAEGAAAQTVLAADVVSPDILAALDLLAQPLRLVATLRS